MVGEGRHATSGVSVKVDDGFVWFWIGSHSDYDKLVG
jgi:hypothetical protein